MSLVWLYVWLPMEARRKAGFLFWRQGTPETSAAAGGRAVAD